MGASSNSHRSHGIKAFTYTRDGPPEVVELTKLPTPVPNDDEVRVRVLATTSLGGKTYDVVVDTAGTAPFSRSREVLAQGGRLLLVNATLPEMLRAPWVNLTSDFKVIAGSVAERPEYVRELVRLAEAGRFLPVIDRCYPFAQMREAHRHVDRGHKRGSVVVRLGDTQT